MGSCGVLEDGRAILLNKNCQTVTATVKSVSLQAYDEQQLVIDGTISMLQLSKNYLNEYI
jgi:hypothetical protein